MTLQSGLIVSISQMRILDSKMDQGTKEIVQLVKYLTRKHEVLSRIPSAYIKMSGVLAGIRNLSIGCGWGGGEWISRAHWSASPPKQ